jgi:cbb3-type cytochrome oxidase subunit 3
MINVTEPEQPGFFKSETTKNLAVIISISVILGTLFFGTVAYTIYWKTRRGYYDEDNNETNDPEKRRENIDN